MSLRPLTIVILLFGLLLGQGGVSVADDSTQTSQTVEDVAALLEILGRDAGIVDRRWRLIDTHERLIAVGERDSDAVVPMIIEKLQTLRADDQGTEQYQIALIRILEHLGKAAEAAVRVLAEIALDDDPDYEAVSLKARSVLDDIGTPNAVAANRAVAVAMMESWLITASQAEVERSVRQNVFLIRQQLRNPDMSEALIELPVLNLLAIGQNAEAAVPVLLQALNDPRVGEELSVMIAGALAAAGVADVPAAAAATAGQRQMDRLEAIIADTRSDDEFINHSAIMELGGLGPSEPAIDALIEALQQNRSPGTAAFVLGEYGPPAARAAPFVLPYLRDPQDGANAVRALGKIGSSEPEIIAALNELAADWRSPRDPQRDLAIAALADLAVANLPRLIEALSSPSKETRIQAAESLGRVGQRAADAVPALAALLADPDIDVRQSATFVLQRIGGENAATALRIDARRYAQSDEEEYRRLRTANDLDDLMRFVDGLPDARRVQIARLMIDDADPQLAGEGINILTRVGRAEETVPVLARMIISGQIGNDALLSLSWMWMHSGDAQLTQRMMTHLSDHLSANIETYSEEGQTRARAFIAIARRY